LEQSDISSVKTKGSKYGGVSATPSNPRKDRLYAQIGEAKGRMVLNRCTKKAGQKGVTKAVRVGLKSKKERSRINVCSRRRAVFMNGFLIALKKKKGRTCPKAKAQKQN